MKDISIQELKNTAVQMRMKVIDMIYKAQSGHPGGSLSAADFVTACYFKYMNVDPKNPRWPDRDRMVLSKGHGTFRSARSFERGNSSGKNRIYSGRIREYSGSLQYKGKKRKHIILKLLYIRSGKDG